MDKRKLRGKAPYDWNDLKTSEWSAVRGRILNAHNRACFRCGTSSIRLNLHHTIYEEGKRAWEYADETLVPLCDVCHGREHTLTKEMVHIIDKMIIIGGVLSPSDRKDIAKELDYKEAKVRVLADEMVDYGFLDKRKDKNIATYTLTNKHILFYPYFDLFNPISVEHTDEIRGITAQRGELLYVGSKLKFTLEFEITSFEIVAGGFARINIKQLDQLDAYATGRPQQILYKEIIPPFLTTTNQ